MKKLLVISFSFLIACSLSSCTSSDGNKENGDTAASSDENMPLDGGGDVAKDASIDGTPAADGKTPPPDASATAGLDDVPLDGNVDAAKNATPPTDGAGSLDLGDPESEFPADVAKSQKDGIAPTDDKLFADSGSPSSAPPPAADPSLTGGNPPDVTATPQDAGASASIAPMDTGAPIDTGAPATAASADPAVPPVVLPYEKIKTEPFEKKGALLNRVYVARDHDTAKGISEKIYGSADHVKDLKAWNPSMKNHAPRVGDKIYYTSPKDPQDNTKMLVFYEEMGVAAQTYVTQPGDDIRKVSKKLLGHKDSWKEIYATNASLENKMGKAPEGIELRYWPSTSDAQPTMPVAANGAPPAPGGGLPPDAMNNTQPDPNTGAAAGTMAPPPPPSGAQAPPPPPPPVAAAPPPPPPMEQPVAQAPPPPPPSMEPKAMKKPASPPQSLDASADPDQTMMMLAGGLLIVAAAAAFIVIRRQRAKRIDLSQQTQV